MKVAWNERITTGKEIEKTFKSNKKYSISSKKKKRRQSTEELMLSMWYWRRLLRVPWTARRSNQSILKEINPGYSLEGLLLKLMLQYFGHLMGRTNSLEKTLMLGKIEGKRERGQQRMSG